MRRPSRREYFQRIYPRYRHASRAEKRRILDEFCANCSYHRKHAIRLLNGEPPQATPPRRRRRRDATYGSRAISILQAVWEAADYPWSVRLKALLPEWMPQIRQRFHLTSELERQLLQISPRSIDDRLRRTPVMPQAIRNLAGFLDATGWQLIYGLNLGKGAPEQDAQEAKAVSESVGGRLIAFQIGNEPDLYHRNRPWDLRPAGWNFDGYFSQWQEFFSAVREKVPDAPFGAPDVANLEATDWVVEFAEKAANEIVLLSGHYYAEGPPTDPRMTIERMLARDPRLLTYTPRIMEASRKNHRPFRMTEGNSCFNGGKRDVSDTFASALWAADYMLFLAQSGYAGVNFHGGGNGIYTPIAGGLEAGFSARPIYYGLLLGEEFAGTTMVETRVEAKAANVTAYAAKTSSGLRVAIFNKDERQAVHATLSTGAPARKATLWRLTAPSVESKTGVRLAGAEVSSDGAWAAEQEYPLIGARGQYTVDLPAASAVIVFLS